LPTPTEREVAVLSPRTAIGYSVVDWAILHLTARLVTRYPLELAWPQLEAVLDDFMTKESCGLKLLTGNEVSPYSN